MKALLFYGKHNMILQKIIDLAKAEKMECAQKGEILKIHKTLAERDVLMSSAKESYDADVKIDESAKTVHFSERMTGANSGLMAGDAEFSSGFGFNVHKEKISGTERTETVSQKNSLGGKELNYDFTLGDFRKKVEALAKENGYAFSNHILPLSAGKMIPKIKALSAIVICSLFYLIGILVMFGGSIIAGLALCMLATAILPRGWIFLESKLPKFAKRRKTLSALFLLVFIFSLGDSSSEPLFKSTIIQGNDDPMVVANVSKDLSELIHVYEQTQMKTAAVLQVPYHGMSLADYQAKLVDIEAGWKQVDKEASDLAQYQSKLPKEIAEPEKVSFLNDLISKAHAQSPHDLTEAYGNPSAEGLLSKSSLYSNFELKNETRRKVLSKSEKDRYDSLSVVREQLPSAKMLDLVQDHFQVTAKEALRIIQEHEKNIGAAWDNDAEFNKRMADAASVMETGTKALLMVGGTVVTGGTLAGASMTKVAVAGTSVFVGGVDAALDVQETAITVYGGDENTLKYIQQTKKDLYPIILLNNVVQVPTDISAFTEGGFGTLFGIGKDIYDGKLDVDGSVNIDLKKGEYVYKDEPVSTKISTPQGEIETINQYLPDYISGMKNPLMEAKNKNIKIDPNSPEYYLKKLQADPEYQKAVKEKATEDAKAEDELLLKETSQTLDNITKEQPNKGTAEQKSTMTKDAQIGFWIALFAAIIGGSWVAVKKKTHN